MRQNGLRAVGVLLGALLAGRLAARFGTTVLMQLCLLLGAVSVAGLALVQNYAVWVGLRLFIGVALTVVFILGESWINQLAVEKWRGRLVALYGTGYALSQLSGPLLLTALGTATDAGFWTGVCLLIGGSLILLGRTGAPKVDAHSASGRGLLVFCRKLPAIAWAVMLFAAFEAMMLTLLPIYGLRQGFTQEVALFMVSVVVVGDAVLLLRGQAGNVAAWGNEDLRITDNFFKGPDLVRGFDIVLDGTDDFATRQAVNAACVAAGKPLVSGAAIRLEGQLSVFDPRNAASPCYHCLYGHGSEAELTCSEAGVVGPLVGLVGSLQALEALKLLAGFGEPLVGRLLLIDALGTRFRELRVKRDPACEVCGGR